MACCRLPEGSQTARSAAAAHPCQPAPPVLSIMVVSGGCRAGMCTRRTHRPPLCPPLSQLLAAATPAALCAPRELVDRMGVVKPATRHSRQPQSPLRWRTTGAALVTHRNFAAALLVRHSNYNSSEALRGKDTFKKRRQWQRHDRRVRWGRRDWRVAKGRRVVSGALASRKMGRQCFL